MRAAAPNSIGRGYSPPASVAQVELKRLLEETGRPALADAQLNFLQVAAAHGDPKSHLYYARGLSLLKRPAVSIVGTREATTDGAKRARDLSRDLCVYRRLKPGRSDGEVRPKWRPNL